MNIVIATGNRHKVEELNRLLNCGIGEYTFISMRDAGFDGKIIEDADTFEGNALIKAKAVCKATGLVAIADDSGLCVDALGGAPGVFSARYAGEPCSDAANNKKLLEELGNTPFEKRTARFCCVIAAAFPDGRTLTAYGDCPGVIAFEKRGSGDFGYDPIFYYPPFDKTFAEMTGDEKNSISHRGVAAANFKKIFFSALEQRPVSAACSD